MLAFNQFCGNASVTLPPLAMHVYSRYPKYRPKYSDVWGDVSAWPPCSQAFFQLHPGSLYQPKTGAVPRVHSVSTGPGVRLMLASRMGSGRGLERAKYLLTPGVLLFRSHPRRGANWVLRPLYSYSLRKTKQISVNKAGDLHQSTQSDALFGELSVPRYVTSSRKNLLGVDGACIPSYLGSCLRKNKKSSRTTPLAFLPLFCLLRHGLRCLPGSSPFHSYISPRPARNRRTGLASARISMAW